MADAIDVASASPTHVPHASDQNPGQDSVPQPYVEHVGGFEDRHCFRPKDNASAASVITSASPFCPRSIHSSTTPAEQGLPAAYALDFDASGQYREHASFAPSQFPHIHQFECDTPTNATRVVFYDTAYISEHEHTDEVEHGDSSLLSFAPGVENCDVIPGQCESAANNKVNC